MTEKIGPPAPLRSVFDFAKGFRELGLSVAVSPWVSRMLPRGDGHPVLVLPGITAGDSSTLFLRRFLNNQGYCAEPWKGGPNWISEKTFRHIETRLQEIHETHDGQKVSIVGWSLGGLYARKLGREYPEIVRNAVSLGSPFHAVAHPGGTVFGHLLKILGPDVQSRLEERLGFDLFENILEPLDTPMTSIYTRDDGIANWRACILPENERTENIEVRSSHLGLGWSARTAAILADRLAQPEGEWAPFDSASYRHLGIEHAKDHAHRLSRNWHFGPAGPVPRPAGG